MRTETSAAFAARETGRRSAPSALPAGLVGSNTTVETKFGSSMLGRRVSPYCSASVTSRLREAPERDLAASLAERVRFARAQPRASASSIDAAFCDLGLGFGLRLLAR